MPPGTPVNPITGALDPRWFQRAVFYEVLVRGFFDSNNDGTGDIKGITEKLDYLEWLGVDCLWLLPFYQSPLRDGGYDISDFFTILPEYGNLADAVELIEQAHSRGLRIIARPGHEPHQRSTPVVPGEQAGPHQPPRPTGTYGAMTTSAGPTPGSSSSTPRSPTGPTTPSAASTTGTGSSPTSRTSTSTTRRRWPRR